MQFFIETKKWWRCLLAKQQRERSPDRTSKLTKSSGFVRFPSLWRRKSSPPPFQTQRTSSDALDGIRSGASREILTPSYCQPRGSRSDPAPSRRNAPPSADRFPPPPRRSRRSPPSRVPLAASSGRELRVCIAFNDDDNNNTIAATCCARARASYPSTDRPGRRGCWSSTTTTPRGALASAPLSFTFPPRRWVSGTLSRSLRRDYRKRRSSPPRNWASLLHALSAKMTITIIQRSRIIYVTSPLAPVPLITTRTGALQIVRSAARWSLRSLRSLCPGLRSANERANAKKRERESLRQISRTRSDASASRRCVSIAYIIAVEKGDGGLLFVKFIV